MLRTIHDIGYRDPIGMEMSPKSDPMAAFAGDPAGRRRGTLLEDRRLDRRREHARCAGAYRRSSPASGHARSASIFARLGAWLEGAPRGGDPRPGGSASAVRLPDESGDVAGRGDRCGETSSACRSSISPHRSTSDQLAPFGFLIVAAGPSRPSWATRNYVLRFLPLAAGIAALYLFSLLAPRILSRRAALVALVLFAFSDDLIYYSSEMKPYSLDLAIGLAVTLAACRVLGRSPSPRAVVWLAVLAAAAPWFSFASAFVVAGCGAVLVLDALLDGRSATALVWIDVGVGWLASFLVAYERPGRMLSPYTTMYRFWDFAFLPVWPSPDAATSLSQGAAGLLLEIFVNPLNLVAPGRAQARRHPAADPPHAG